MISPVSSVGSQSPASGSPDDSLESMRAQEARLQADESRLSGQVQEGQQRGLILGGLASSARGQVIVERARIEDKSDDDENEGGGGGAPKSTSYASGAASSFSMAQTAIGTQTQANYADLTRTQNQLASVRSQIAAYG